LLLTPVLRAALVGECELNPWLDLGLTRLNRGRNARWLSLPFSPGPTTCRDEIQSPTICRHVIQLVPWSLRHHYVYPL